MAPRSSLAVDTPSQSAKMAVNIGAKSGAKRTGTHPWSLGAPCCGGSWFGLRVF